MAVFSGEVTIKVKFKNLKVPVGYGMTFDNPINRIENSSIIYIRSFRCFYHS
jgi:hypothetical protein